MPVRLIREIADGYLKERAVRLLAYINRRIHRFVLQYREKPLVTDWWPIVLLMSYTSILFSVLLGAIEGEFYMSHLFASLLISLFVPLTAVIARSRGTSHDTDDEEIRITPPVLYVLTGMLVLMLAGLYAISTLWILPENSNRLLVVAIIYAMMVGNLFALLGRPFVPVTMLEGEEKRQYLTDHLTNWWRAAQLIVSIYVAFGIGIAATSLMQQERSDARVQTINALGEIDQLSLLTVVFMAGIPGLLLYVLLKFHFITEESNKLKSV